MADELDALREILKRVADGEAISAGLATHDERRMARAILGVLDEHKRTTTPPEVDAYCTPCLMHWPCPTVRVILDAMKGEG